MQPVVTLLGDSPALRLLPSEIEELVNFTFMAHDHDAKRPARPIFWLRTTDAADPTYWN
jgi:hypothetical protein